MAKKPSSGDKAEVSPWLKGVANVKGVVPPGRRLSPVGERRSNKWSASGVTGVRPPGKQKVGENPGVTWASKEAKAKDKALKATQRQLEEKKRGRKPGRPEGKDAGEAFDPLRPMAGFVPDAFDDASDPDSLKAFLDQLGEFLTENRPNPEVAEHFSQLVLQSHAPYEIVVGFTVLNGLVGKSTPLRRRYSLALERGAKTFYNLAARMNGQLKAPRGLVPETVDALFYDLPAIAFQVPFAYATDAFLRMIDLIRDGTDLDFDRVLIKEARALRRRFIERRSFGDQPLSRMFPWEEPDWAP